MKTKMLKIQSLFGAKAQRMAFGLFTAAALLLTGCNKGDSDPDAEPFLTIDPSTDAIAFSADATESYTYRITTNQPVWLATSDQEWCVVTMDAYDNSFTVTALRNGADTPPPAARITVSAGSLNTLTITATQAAVTSYDVYVSGYYETEDFNTRACYWKNNVRTELSMPDGATRSHCSSVTVSGGSVYMAGSINGAGCYWKDGGHVGLPKPDPVYTSAPEVNSIAVDGNTVYACSPEFYWKNGTAGKLPVRFTGKAVAASGGSVYFAGQANLSIGSIYTQLAYYWAGSGSAMQLKTPGKARNDDATCAYISEGVNYAGGHYVSGSVQYPCYWKDGECVTLAVPQGMTENTVGGICVAGGIVYVAGTCGDGETIRACYWENDSRTELELPDGAYNTAVSGITVAGGKVCVAGQYQDATDKTRACYWVNGKRTDLPKGTAESAYATGIVLIVK